MTINFEELGFTRRELQERIVQNVSKELLVGFTTDEDGEAHATPSVFKEEMKLLITGEIKDRVKTAVEEHVLPQVKQRIETLVLEETNRFGEKIPGKTYTFIEYLIKCADDHMMETVDFQGRGTGHPGHASHYKAKTQTRLTHMIHGHLHYSIDKAMQAAIKEANSKLTTSIAETAVLKLKEIADSLSVSVKTG